tara:strand:- start:2544 stop:3221 length:678 start_codon:yes stop_codon:yes gene_type:complete
MVFYLIGGLTLTSIVAYRYSNIDIIEIIINIYKFCRNSSTRIHKSCFRPSITYYNYNITDLSIVESKLSLYNNNNISKIIDTEKWWDNKSNINIIKLVLYHHNKFSIYNKLIYNKQEFYEYKDNIILYDTEELDDKISNYPFIYSTINIKDKSYDIDLKQYCMLGNRFDSIFIKYYLHKHYKIIIDILEEYKLVIMDNNANLVTIHNKQFIELTEDGYNIKDMKI